MELKLYETPEDVRDIVEAFNRTSMELKRGYHESPCQNDVTFNRTSMELKRFSLRRDRAAGRGF